MKRPRIDKSVLTHGEPRAQMQVRVVELGMHGGRSKDGEYRKPESHGSGPVGLDDEIPF